uniref:Uncharacterized protein n=2 Tax=Oryza TaxID=4527 RepID=A0A0E0PD05_ORYRU
MKAHKAHHYRLSKPTKLPRVRTRCPPKSPQLCNRSRPQPWPKKPKRPAAHPNGSSDLRTQTEGV